jgi:antitoxin ParD1/3/4
MNISLHPDLQKFIDDQLKAGHYESAEALINTAVARLQSEDFTADDLAELRAEIAIAIEQADRGELEDWDINDIRAEGQRLLSQAPKKAI